MPFFGGGGSGGTGDYVITGTNIDGGTNAMPAVVGDNNMALGNAALQLLTTGDQNISIGNNSGNTIDTGNGNILIGFNAGQSANSGAVYGNVIIGDDAGNGAGTYSDSNVLIGGLAGNAKATQGIVATIAVGYSAMLGGAHNASAAVGYGAASLYNGYSSLSIFMGNYAGAYQAIAGAGYSYFDNSVVLGAFAALHGAGTSTYTINGATIIGYNALRKNNAAGNLTATDTIAIGRAAGYTTSAAALDVSNSIYIGTDLVPSGANELVIGDSSITSYLIGSIINSGKTFTTNLKVLDLAATWNNAGVTFTGLKFNVTNTASALASALMDLQADGVSQYKFNKSAIASTGVPAFAIGNDTGFRRPFPSQLRVITAGNDEFCFSGYILKAATDGSFSWENTAQAGSGSVVLSLFKDANDTLAQRRSTNAQTFRLYNTYTDASNYERATFTWSGNVCYIKPENAGTGTARLFVPVTGATTVAGLPAAATAGIGARSFVTDANATMAAGIGTAVVGGGANKVPVYSDGANWFIG